MNKTKLIPILISALLLGVTAGTSIGDAEAILEGRIEAEITGFLGIITPTIDLTESQNVTFAVKIDNISETGYRVNDTLMIEVNKTGDPERNIFLVPRVVCVGIVLAREITVIDILSLSPNDRAILRIVGCRYISVP